MKKIMRKLGALALALTVSLCLSSCVDLDEIKANRAVYTDDSRKEILFQGNKYKRVDDIFDDYLRTYYLEDSADVVTEDIPLLLTEHYGDGLYYNKTDTRLIWRSYGNYYFCREDWYDYFMKTLEENKFEYVCVEHYDYYTEEYSRTMLDKTIVDTVDEIIYSVEPRASYPDTYRSVTINATDKEGLLMHNLFCVEELAYGGYFITMDNLSHDIAGYVVPEKYEDEFKILFPEDNITDSYSEGMQEKPSHYALPIF